MSNYLKKFLFTLLILVIPYTNSASKAMNVEDYDGSTLRARKVSFVTEDQKDVQSFTKHSTSSQVVSLEDPQNSWVSYLISPLKANIQTVYDTLRFAVQNPRKGMIFGLCLASQIMLTAAQYDIRCEFLCISGSNMYTVPQSNVTADYCTANAPGYCKQTLLYYPSWNECLSNGWSCPPTCL